MRKITKDFWASVNSLAWFALCLVVVAVHPGRALADAGLLHRVSLLPGVQGQMWSDGTVRFQAGASDRSTLVLQLQSIDLADPQRAAEPGPVFTGVYTEGTVGGQRGLANDADDDGDGVTDEDRADGRDNDGDGLIDEDFAAIGEVMTVVSSEDRHGNQHLETYHWSYPHLQSTILIASRHEASDSVRQPAVSITASGGQIWKSADRSWRLHGRAGAAALPRAPIFVTSLPDPSGSGEQLWLGLSRLDRLQGRSSVPGRARHEGSRIEIPLREGACDLALTVARTYLQLLANLEAAQGVHLGARNRGSSDRIPWVVPPLCPACLSDEIPAVSLRQLGSESWSLVFRVEPRQNVLFDPERFRIGEVSLGPPVRIHWRGWAVGRPAAPDDRSTPPRERWSVAWTSPSLDDLDRLDLQ